MKNQTGKVYKLTPTVKDYIWGGAKLKEMYGRVGERVAESWELSVHPAGLSGIAGGTLADYLKENPTAVDPDGGKLPVLIKYIDAKQKLSVQVHPDDDYANRVEGDRGKTEMWYVVQADEGAGIYCGFKQAMTKRRFIKRVNSGTVEELLNFIPVKKGDCFLIKAGTVHAICAGCVICEVQQSSNLTYRVYDYNRKGADGKPRPLHIQKAVDVINFEAFSNTAAREEYFEVDGGKMRNLTKCKYFRCRELLLDGHYTEQAARSFIAVNVIEGSGKINGIEYSDGDSFFVPFGTALDISGSGTVLLTDESDMKYFAGVDIGGTFIKCGIVSESGDVLCKDKIPTGKDRDYTEIAGDIACLIDRLAKKVGVKIYAVGMGVPGTVDSKNGVIVYSNNIAWKDIPLCGKMKELIGLPVYITNDANAAALGESFVGAGRSYKNIALLTLGTGVGGGMIIDGKLYEGGRSAGVEFGHIVIKKGGKKCTCGRRGCLEAYASATALVKQILSATKKHPDSDMARMSENTCVTPEFLFEALERGDKLAKKVFDKYISYLAEGIIDIANIFRPDVILLGGGISAQGDVLLVPLKKKLSENIFGGNDYATVKLEIAALGNDAGLIGAARLAMTQCTA